mmetsp:Transcript_7011/g.19037  ORF Transcript_7011/g.19037 Transcript_7011/m.19037 type:complete len:224 (-) Transcript_7011:284-955(-)
MVLTDALCYINLASSAMMNGMCCYYQMQEEKQRQQDHEESIRRAIREEWDRNRLFDMQQRYEEEKQFEQTGGTYYAKVRPAPLSEAGRVDHRRSELMRVKGKANGSATSLASESSSGSYGGNTRRHTDAGERCGAVSHSYSSPGELVYPRRMFNAQRPRRDSRDSVTETQGHLQSGQGFIHHQLSSLMDDDDDDDHDGDDDGTDQDDSVKVRDTASFEEIVLE